MNIIQRLLEGQYISILEDGDKATISADVSADYYNKAQINELLGDLDTVKFKVVSALPAVGAENVIYLVPKTAPDVGYEQYIWDSHDAIFYPIGDTDIDLSDYYTKEQSDARYYNKTETYSQTEADAKFQELLSNGTGITTVSDTTDFSQVSLGDKTVRQATGLSIWNYIKSKLTGAISTVVTDDMTGNRVLVSTPLGKITYSPDITTDELYYLNNARSNIQDQIDGKMDSIEMGAETDTMSDSTPLTYLDVPNNETHVVRGSVIWTYIWKKIYPVGSIYISVNNTNPATLFGGSWTQIKDRFLLAVGDTYTSANSTGGSSTMTITRANLPRVSITTSSAGKKTFDLDGVKGFAYKGGGVDNKWGMDYGRKELYEKSSYGSTEETASDHTHSFNLNGNVAQTATNNMPPYITVYMWRRVS